MIDLVMEPLHYEFMIRGLIASVMVGVVCAVVGSYVVLRGMAFYGGALAHTILPGVAVGYLVGGGDRKTLFWWGILAAILSALGIGAISQSTKVREDTAIGIIFAGMFALGIAIISTVRNYSVDLTHFLFGNILGVSRGDLILTGVFSLIVLLVVFIFYKEFLVISFDPVLAKTLRLPARSLHFLQLILISITIVVSLQTVGIALMLAMLVTPAAAAFLWVKRLSTMMLFASLAAITAGITGLYVSYYINISSGASIVLAATLIFLLSWTAKKLKTCCFGRTR